MNNITISETERIRREKISKAGTGRVFSDITRKKISESRKGIVFSDTHIENLKKSHLGKSNYPKGYKPAKLVHNKPHTEETKKKLAQYTGEKASGWRGGISKINKKIRTSYEYFLWKKAVLERDDYKCVLCGFETKWTTPSDVEVDHIKPFAFYPELRFAIDNGRVLCVPCHKKDTIIKRKNKYKI